MTGKKNMLAADNVLVHDIRRMIDKARILVASVVNAGLFRTVPLKLKDKDRGKEPHRPKTDYPWFWCEEEPGTDPVGEEEFVGARWNNVHLTFVGKRRQTHEKSINMDAQGG